MANISMERFQAIVDEVSNQDGTTLEYRRGVSCLATLLLIELSSSEASSSDTERKGYWKGKQMDRWIYAECSECGTVHDAPSNFCPHCGVPMISKELKMPPVIKFNGMMSGGVVTVIGDTPLVIGERILEKRLDNNEGIAFVRRTNIDGIFDYGLEQTEDNYFGHKAGYIWSSRASAMNKVLDVALVEICYKTKNSSMYSSCAIDVPHLIRLLENTEYEVVTEPRVKESDVYYDVKRKKGETENGER